RAVLSRRPPGRAALHRPHAPCGRRGADHCLCAGVRSPALSSRRRGGEADLVRRPGGERLGHDGDHHAAVGRGDAARRRHHRRRRGDRLAASHAPGRRSSRRERDRGDHALPLAAGSRDGAGAQRDLEPARRGRAGPDVEAGGAAPRRRLTTSRLALPAALLEKTGMTDVTRRDFLNGIALTIASRLPPADQLGAQTASGRYPPALTGLRGQHDGSFEVAHALRNQPALPIDTSPIEERYDLVVVGGGISGLAAAWFYRRADPRGRILVLDNHDDFGGHAKRNEFRLDGRLRIGYGGSEALQSPKTLYSAVAKGLLRDLGVDIARFDTAFERNLYPSLGLSRAIFFARESFGRDVLVAGDASSMSGEDEARRSGGKPIAELVAAFPISPAGQAQLLSLYDRSRDPLAGKSIADKREILKRTSYRDYLTRICGASEEVANCFQGRTLGFFGLGADAVPAADARDLGYPGFAGLRLP